MTCWPTSAKGKSDYSCSKCSYSKADWKASHHREGRNAIRWILEHIVWQSLLEGIHSVALGCTYEKWQRECKLWKKRSYEGSSNPALTSIYLANHCMKKGVCGRVFWKLFNHPTSSSEGIYWCLNCFAVTKEFCLSPDSSINPFSVLAYLQPSENCLCFLFIYPRWVYCYCKKNVMLSEIVFTYIQGFICTSLSACLPFSIFLYIPPTFSDL